MVAHLIDDGDGTRLGALYKGGVLKVPSNCTVEAVVVHFFGLVRGVDCIVRPLQGSFPGLSIIHIGWCGSGLQVTGDNVSIYQMPP